jgi:PKD repeat protein
LLVLFLLIGFSSYLFFPSKALAGSSPYDVPTNVRSGWDSIYGGKIFNEYSGKMLIYDVYSSKYISSGYSIQNRNFGQGTQPYVWFTGWAVLFGNKDHTAGNNDTYIVAKKVKGSGIGTEKVYGTITRGWHATEDLEYNNQGTGIYNECASSVTNVPNDTCNMRYDYVGFEAFLPVDELFSNSKENASWKLYIVKQVDSRIVYTPLILPFSFDNKSFNGGEVSLSSGVNANTLKMNTSGVLRRSYPRETASSVIGDLGSNRYFTEGNNYTRVDVEESQTAIWYGVRSPHDSNRTKWAVTAYWQFAGSQAEIEYTPPPNKPPVANFTYSPTTIYNNTTVNFTEQASDPDNDPLRYQWAYQTPGSNTWVNFSTSANPTKILNIKGTWDIRLTVTDPDGLSDSIIKSPVVVNRPPVADFTYSPTTIYNNTTVSFNENASDLDNDSLSYQWAYQTPGSSTWVNFSTSVNPSKVLNIKGTWDIKLTVTDSSGVSDYQIKSPVVNNRPPVADFTYSPKTIYNNTTVNFNKNASDADGDTLTYQWAYQTPGSSTWVNFSSAANPTKVLNIKGTWDIRLTVTDSSGSSSSKTKSPVVINRAPVANFTFDKSDYFVGDTATINDASYDLDGDILIYKYTIIAPNGTSMGKTTAEFTYYFNVEGDYKFKLEVQDPEGAKDTIIKIVSVKELTIEGVVNHTLQWEEIHHKKGNLPHQFYSGEDLVLAASITNYPANYVKATLDGKLVNGNMYTRSTSLTKMSNISYTGMFAGQDFIEKYPLRKGFVPIEFEVQYINGQVRKHKVNIEIIDNALNAYSLHRLY